MPIRDQKRITRTMLQAEPETLWAFGDNLQRRGLEPLPLGVSRIG